MHDSFAVHRFLETAKPRRAVIVGAGYIGLEMADALTHRGIEVTVASRTPTVLPTVDAKFGTAVEGELERNGVKVHTSAEVNRIAPGSEPSPCLREQRPRTELRSGFDRSRCEAVCGAGGRSWPGDRDQRPPQSEQENGE